jgi:RNA polymerase sigma-70 factor (ECF subfamily)
MNISLTRRQSMTSESLALLLEAKRGGTVEQGKLLSLYSNYLKILAQTQLDRRIRRRVSASDLVQETMLEAHRDFSDFRGVTTAEFVGWLRRILVHNLIRVTEKHLQTDKRDVRREVYIHRLHASIEQSNSRLEHVLVGHHESPSSALGRHERMRLLADAMAKLPKDHRQIILMRHIEGLPFAEIATQMDRTSGACRMLWLRAMDQLRASLDGAEFE